VRLNALTRIELGDPPERSAAATSGDNPFIPGDGRPLQLTRMREGNGPKTLRCHPPPSKHSGVTLGYGYDIGTREPAQVQRDLAAVGIEQEKIDSVLDSTGKRGPAAKRWLSENQAAVAWTISEEQRDDLLQRIWPNYQAKARRQATARNKDTLNTVISAERFAALDADTRELLTDLGYVGAPLVYNQDKINRICGDEQLDTPGRLRALREFVSGLIPKQQGAAGRKLRIQWIDAKLQTLGQEP
jgi:hypothetical protein